MGHQLHVPGDPDRDDGTCGAEFGECAVVVAGALAEAVAGEVCCNERNEQHIGAGCWQDRWGFGDAAVARCEVCKAGAMESERRVAGDARKGGGPAGCDCGRLEGGRVGFVAECCIGADEARRAEVGKGDAGERAFERAADRPRETCNERLPGGPRLAAERLSLCLVWVPGRFWIVWEGQRDGFPLAVSGGGTASTVCMKIL